MKEGGVPEQGIPVRLLLVEDSENDAMLLLRELGRGGYEPLYRRVCTPEDMERELGEAEARGEPYEVIVSDYFMPRFTAPEALALLRSRGYDTPFIVVSGKIGEDAAVEIMRAGANDYVTKENMARLCPAIGRELQEARVRKERTRAEEALARSEIRFRRLVEQAADAIFVHDLDGRLVDLNRQACDSLGYGRDELLGMSVSDIEVGGGAGSLREIWEEVSSGTPLTVEGEHRRKDGTTFPVEVRVGVFESGENKLMLALARDVTARRETERKVRETETRYRTLVEQIPAITYVQDPHGDKRVTYVSPQVESVLGYPADRDMLDPDHWIEIMHPDDRERVLEEDRRTDASGEPFKAEYRQFAADGRMVWIRDEATLVRDEEGEPLYWQGVQYDITEGKLVEEELRRSEERYRTFIDQSTEGIWRFELEEPMPVDLPEDDQLDHFYRHAYLAECNDAVARAYGLGSAGELLGARVGDLLPRSEPGNVAFLRMAARSGYRLKDGESREVDREGRERIILNNLSGVVEDGRLVRVWGTQRDVTEQKLIDEQLARLASFPELNPNPIVETGTEGVPTYLNPAAQARFPDLRELGPHHPFLADLDEVNRRIWSAGGRPFTRELRVGEDFYQQVVSRTPEGGLLRIYGTEVTERRRSEDALKESRENLQAILDYTTAVIYVKDEEGRFTLVNRRFEELFDLPKEKILGRTDHEIFPREDADEYRRNDVRVLRSGLPIEAEETVSRGDGTRTYFSVKFPLKGLDGRPYAVCGISTDITGRKRAEEALRQSEELYRSVVEQAAEGIFLLDPDTMRVIEANAALGTALGYAPEQMRGMSFYDISAHDKESVDRNAERVLEAGRLSIGARQYRRRDGGMVDVEISISVVPYDGRRAMCVVAHDVTERRRAERALGEIREAERNRMARELHDSILQDIVYALQEIQILQVTSRGGEPALDDAADALRRSVEGLRGAIFDLRLNEALDRSFVHSLESLVDLNRRMARGAYAMELAVGEGVPEELPGEVGREVVRIIQEALTNVRRHADARHVRISLVVEGDELRVEVADDGRGFDPTGVRAGVGRHSMRQRALDIGGALEVASEPGGGTRVLCRVPLRRPPGDGPPVHPADGRRF